MSNHNHILVVEDDNDNLNLLSCYLKESGYEVSVAKNGLEALEFTARSGPDMILMDIMMPGMDGFETCERLKSNPETASIPVIFITALINVEDKIRGFEAGGIDYVSKPIHREELLARVSAHMTIHQLQEQLKAQNSQLQQEIKQRREAEEKLLVEKAYLEELFRSSPAAVILVDTHGKVLRINTEFTRLFGYEEEEILGKNVDAVLTTPEMKPEAESLTRQVDAGKKVFKETQRLHKDGTLIQVSVIGAPVKFRKGRLAVYGIYHDITERKRVEQERENLILDLQSALDHIKTLKGLIPICAWCKKVRDDEGYWQQVEDYISAHTETKFTHGICPDCLKDWNPQLYRKKYPGKKDG